MKHTSNKCACSSILSSNHEIGIYNELKIKYETFRHNSVYTIDK